MDKPKGHRLRTGRFSEPNRYYLVTSVTKDRKAIFSDLWLGRIVVASLMHHHHAGHVNSLAFVVMPDHFHWLLQLTEKSSLPRLMRSVKSYTARTINAHIQTPGRQCWQAGFHDHALRKEEELVAVARYIVANPLRAGLVTRLGDYPLWDAVWL